MGLSALHRPAVLHAPPKSPWLPSFIKMFGSCAPPTTLPVSPIPLYTGRLGSSGCASQLEWALPPRS